MSDELKACQHCGSTQTHFERWLDEVVNGQPSYKVYYRIACVTCEFSPDHWEETAEAAIEYWNTRPLEDALLTRAEAAEREIERLRLLLADVIELGMKLREEGAAQEPFDDCPELLDEWDTLMMKTIDAMKGGAG